MTILTRLLSAWNWFLPRLLSACGKFAKRRIGRTWLDLGLGALVVLALVWGLVKVLDWSGRGQQDFELTVAGQSVKLSGNGGRQGSELSICSVPAHRLFTDTGVTLQEGETLEISATGLVSTGLFFAWDNLWIDKESEKSKAEEAIKERVWKKTGSDDPPLMKELLPLGERFLKHQWQVNHHLGWRGPDGSLACGIPEDLLTLGEEPVEKRITITNSTSERITNLGKDMKEIEKRLMSLRDETRDIGGSERKDIVTKLKKKVELRLAESWKSEKDDAVKLIAPTLRKLLHEEAKALPGKPFGCLLAYLTTGDPSVSHEKGKPQLKYEHIFEVGKTRTVRFRKGLSFRGGSIEIEGAKGSIQIPWKHSKVKVFLLVNDCLASDGLLKDLANVAVPGSSADYELQNIFFNSPKIFDDKFKASEIWYHDNQGSFTVAMTKK